MDETRERDGTPASVMVEEVPPVTPRRKRSNEVIVAEQQGRMETTVERSTEGGSPVTTTHTRPGTKVMYKPTEHQGYVPRIVSRSAVGVLLGLGWYEFCPDCGGEHLDKNGQHSTDPNLCTARPPMAVRVCPVCRKRFYDNVRFTEVVEQAAAEDPNVIVDESYEQSTPEQRTRVLLNLHLWKSHPRQAQMMNIEPLPQALREIVQEPGVV